MGGTWEDQIVGATMVQWVAMEIPPRHRQFLLDIARSAIVHTLKGAGHLVAPRPSGDPVLNIPAGCFVSLHEVVGHRLRGCVGRLQSQDPLFRTVFETAVSVLNDPRFAGMPVRLEELRHLSIEISVLSPLKPAASCMEFDPLNDGIYLMCVSPEGESRRTGTFLPQVGRETGWSREQLLARLCTEKMGLSSDAWQRPDARLLTYRTVICGPEPFLPPTELQQPGGRAGTIASQSNAFRI
jgi:AmmeMemoRadiSam system protein A